MKLTIALVFSLLVAASVSQAAVGFHVAPRHVWSQEKVTVTSLRTLRGVTEGVGLDYLHMPLLIAQAGQQSEQGRIYTLADGYTAGRIAAQDLSTKDHVLQGILGGMLTGPIAPGILWGVTRGDDVPLQLHPDVQEKGSDYSMGFVKGYKERTKQKKRGARLGGGLLGAVVLFWMLWQMDEAGSFTYM